MALSLYDRHIPFFDGTVEVRDVDLQVLAVGEANSLRDGGRRHHRMLIDLEFDACEVSLSSYVMAKSQGLSRLLRSRFSLAVCLFNQIFGPTTNQRFASRWT